MREKRLLNKGSESKVAKKTTMEDLVDEYATICLKEKSLKEAKARLREEFIEKFNIGDTVLGNDYKISITERVTPILDSIKVAKKVGSKNFVKIATVSVTAAKEYIAPVDLEKVTKGYKKVITISAKPIK